MTKHNFFKYEIDEIKGRMKKYTYDFEKEDVVRHFSSKLAKAIGNNVVFVKNLDNNKYSINIGDFPTVVLTVGKIENSFFLDNVEITEEN